MSEPHVLWVEITVAACILDPEMHALGDNMVDATLAFGASAAAPNRPVSDPEISEALAGQIGRVLAAIEAVMPQLGFRYSGDVDEPMTKHSDEVGRGVTPPVRVHLNLTDEARA